MEVISKGSFEAAELEGSNSALSSRSTATPTPHSENQLTLEFLPPEGKSYYV